MKTKQNWINFSLNVISVLAFIVLYSVNYAVALEVVYENMNVSGSYAPRPYEIGDQITLAGTERFVTEFTFGYSVSNTRATGNESTIIKFYDLNGTEPGNLLYQSTPIPVAGNSFETTYTLSSLNVFVPETFIWTVSVDGLNATLPNLYYTGPVLAAPVSVGSSDDWFWQDAGLGLDKYFFNTGEPGNFRAQVIAGTVPEPSTILLLSFALLGLLVYRKKYLR